MAEHRYILEPYKGRVTRYTCPECRKQKTFARYIDTETGSYVSENAGRCNREDNCGFHYTPKQHFEDNNVVFNATYPTRSTLKPSKCQPKPASTIAPEIFKGSLSGYNTNHFIIYLISIFGPDTASHLIERYFIGTSKQWEGGATVFWQIDSTGRVRAGKIMLYSSDKGKRVKEPYNHLTWVHSTLKLCEYNLKQCFFGEHLLNTEPCKPIAIVESEKTAIIASVYLPQFIWFAAGCKNGLKEEKCQVLKGRKVVLFPDLNAFDKWNQKAQEFSHLASFTVSDLLERNATEAEKEQGLDLADYLIRTNYKRIIEPDSVEINLVVPEEKPILQKEFYHHTYTELQEALGEEGAFHKVKQYQALSKQFENCKSFVIHHSALLSTYYQSQHYKKCLK